MTGECSVGNRRNCNLEAKCHRARGEVHQHKVTVFLHTQQWPSCTGLPAMIGKRGSRIRLWDGVVIQARCIGRAERQGYGQKEK